MKLVNIPPNYKIIINIPNIAGAYKVYINNQLVSESEKIGKTIDEIYCIPLSKIFPFTTDETKEYNVVIEYATKKYGGLYMTPQLTTSNNYYKENILVLIRNTFLLGALSCIFLLTLIRALVIKVKKYTY